MRLALLLTGLLVMALAPATAAQSENADAQASLTIDVIDATSELAAGPNRLLFSLVDKTGQLVAAPDVSVGLRFYDATDPASVAFEADSRFIWAIEDSRGLYASNVSFPHAGLWGALFDVTLPDGSIETGWHEWDVLETTSTPSIGGPAPSLETPTAASVGGDLRQISTDPEPLARMYELSLDEAIAAGAPLVVTFATPAFCQSATCGPTLEKVKAVALAHPEVNFVHLEPYVMAMQNEQLQPVLSQEGYLQTAPWTEAWALRTEPYVVVVGADGTVRAKFEGAITTDELEEALAAL